MHPTALDPCLSSITDWSDLHWALTLSLQAVYCHSIIGSCSRLLSRTGMREQQFF